MMQGENIIEGDGGGFPLSQLILLHQNLSAVDLSQEDHLLNLNIIACFESVKINSTG